ncbi:MAG: hypothetical protein CMN32_00170 [Saprospirales bacterium]|nr:hypothetical protein [Saprospirales bacterium]
MNKYILIFTLPFVMLACAGETSQHTHEEEHPVQATGDSLVHLTHAQVGQGNIGFGQFTVEEISDLLTANGSLVIHPENMAQVTAFTDGIVEYIAPVLNKNVSKGQSLVRIRKPDLLDMQEQYLSLKSQLPFLRSEFERYKLLKEKNATAVKNFEKAEAEYNAASANLKVLAAKLQQFGIDAETLSPEKLVSSIALKAPISGTVTAIDASLGASVQPGDVLMDVVNLASLHADLWIYEKDLPLVKTGQPVQLSFPSVPGQKVQGEIYSLDRRLDEEKRAVRAHVRLTDSGDGNFVEGAFIQGDIQLGESATSPTLPEGAVAREGDEEFIFYKMKEDAEGMAFVKVPVKVIATKNGMAAVKLLENIPEGAQIVVRGAYYISAHSAMAGMEHEH